MPAVLVESPRVDFPGLRVERNPDGPSDRVLPGRRAGERAGDDRFFGIAFEREGYRPHRRLRRPVTEEPFEVLQLVLDASGFGGERHPPLPTLTGVDDDVLRC